MLSTKSESIYAYENPNIADLITSWTSQINARLDRIQDCTNQRALNFYHDPVGFGGQVSRRLFALRLALITGARACFPDETMHPYRNPFVRMERQGISTGTCESLDQAMQRGAWVKDFDYWTFCSNDSDASTAHRSLPNGAPPAASEYALQVLLDGILMRRQALLPTISDRLRQEPFLSTLPSRYISVHFRRGDKRVEAPYVPARVYRHAILELSQISGIKDVFIASDSPTALTDLGLEKIGLNTFFDSNEERRNNANHKYLAKNQTFADAETFTAIKNIHALGGGEYIVGQHNAHFATLAAGLIATRRNSLNVGCIIDGNYLLNTLRWRYFYKTLLIFRRIAKRCLPHLTIQGANNRVR
jgi:hypothetical protein